LVVRGVVSTSNSYKLKISKKRNLYSRHCFYELIWVQTWVRVSISIVYA